MFEFQCPQCGHRYQSRKALHNAAAKCAQCGHVFRITVGPESAARTSEPDPLADLQRASEQREDPSQWNPNDDTSLDGPPRLKPPGEQDQSPAGTPASIPRTRPAESRTETRNLPERQRPQPQAPAGTPQATAGEEDADTFLPDEDDDDVLAGTPVGHPNASHPSHRPGRKKGLNPALFITPILLILVIVLIVLVFSQKDMVWVDIKDPATGRVVERRRVSLEEAQRLQEQMDCEQAARAAERLEDRQKALIEDPGRRPGAPGDDDPAMKPVTPGPKPQADGIEGVKLADWQVIPDVGSDGTSGLLVGQISNLTEADYKTLDLSLTLIDRKDDRPIHKYKTWADWVPAEREASFSQPFQSHTAEFDLRLSATGQKVQPPREVWALDTATVAQKTDLATGVITLEGPVRNPKPYGIEEVFLYAVFMDLDGQIVGRITGRLDPAHENRIRAGGEARFTIIFNVAEDTSLPEAPLLQTIKRWEIRLIGQRES